MNVLLSDDTLTGVLKAGDTSSGVLPKATEFAVSQRFLAETAMIAAEEPNSARAIVVARRTTGAHRRRWPATCSVRPRAPRG